MKAHRLTPEQAMLRNYYAEISRLSWKLRKLTGGALRLAMQMSVPEAMRDDVLAKVKELQLRHGIKDDP